MYTTRRCQPWLGTLVHIQADFAREQHAVPAMDRAFVAVRLVHECMSLRRHDSDVARINTSAIGVAVKVDTSTADVLHMAKVIERETGGAFNVCCADPKRAERGALAAAGGIEITGRWVTRLAPVRIDLGGIAKGYAVDRAVAALQANGARSGVVNAGGDMRFFGDKPQPLTIHHPHAPACEVIVASMVNGAAATSYFGSRPDSLADGILVDGRSGQALRHGLVTVIAPDCMTADALTKVTALLGDAADAILHRHGAEALWLPEPEPLPLAEAA